jgi:hypothetical protein
MLYDNCCNCFEHKVKKELGERLDLRKGRGSLLDCHSLKSSSVGLSAGRLVAVYSISHQPIHMRWQSDLVSSLKSKKNSFNIV